MNTSPKRQRGIRSVAGFPSLARRASVAAYPKIEVDRALVLFAFLLFQRFLFAAGRFEVKAEKRHFEPDCLERFLGDVHDAGAQAKALGDSFVDGAQGDAVLFWQRVDPLAQLDEIGRWRIRRTVLKSRG